MADIKEEFAEEARYIRGLRERIKNRTRDDGSLWTFDKDELGAELKLSERVDSLLTGRRMAVAEQRKTVKDLGVEEEKLAALQRIERNEEIVRRLDGNRGLRLAAKEVAN